MHKMKQGCDCTQCVYTYVCVYVLTNGYSIILLLFISPGEGNGNPLHYSCLENSMDRGVWWATVHGVTQSRREVHMFKLLKMTKCEL